MVIRIIFKMSLPTSEKYEAYKNELTKLSKNVKLGLSKCLQPCRKTILNVELLYSKIRVCNFTLYNSSVIYLNNHFFIEFCKDGSDNQEAQEYPDSEE